MKLFYTPVFILLYLLPGVQTADPINSVAELIRQDNIHELSKLFAPNVEVTLMDDDNVYSKAQTELILDKFFNQNKPKAVKILHKINSNPNYKFGVLIVNTGKDTFRVAFTLKDTDGSLMLIEFRIETEKVK
jgi:Na+-transporting NADH:ubiquinone oxidoreductase subunit NqrC